MSEICKFNHPLLNAKNICEEGHPRAVYLKCIVPGCKYKTHPVEIGQEKLASRILANHVNEVHGRNELTNTEKKQNLMIEIHVHFA